MVYFEPSLFLAGLVAIVLLYGAIFAFTFARVLADLFGSRRKR